MAQVQTSQVNPQANAPVQSAQPQQTQQPVTQPVNNVAQQPAEKKKTSWWVWLIIGMLVFIILCMGLYILIF